MKRDHDLFASDLSAGKAIAGIDEVGRGPLAGPVIAAAVVLRSNEPIDGLDDSKKLTAVRRQQMDSEIRQHALSWSLGRAEVEEIDELNILNATLLAMRRAFEKISVHVDVALVDGLHDPGLACQTIPVVGGDSRFPVISAASIIAKVARDCEMVELSQQFPQYGFESNKGYGTSQHLTALQAYGPCKVHRRTFAPVHDLLKSTKSTQVNPLDI